MRIWFFFFGTAVGHIAYSSPGISLRRSFWLFGFVQPLGLRGLLRASAGTPLRAHGTGGGEGGDPPSALLLTASSGLFSLENLGDPFGMRALATQGGGLRHRAEKRGFREIYLR